MASIVFVHGTGVRQPAYDETVEKLKTRFGKTHPGLKVVKCFYGELHGAKKAVKSLPNATSTAKGAVVDTPDDVDAWAALYADPFAELRWLARHDAPLAGGAPGKVPYPKRAAGEIGALGDDAAWRGRFAAAGVDDAVPKALERVAGFEDLEAAIVGARAIVEVGHEGYDAARESIARAIVAAVIASAHDAHRDLPDGALRDDLVTQTFVALGGTPAGAKGAWVSALKVALKPAAWVAKRGGTWYASRHRGTVNDAVSPFPGDILVYLANGEPIRKLIADTVEAAKKNGPVYLLAHSLGGIACVELLASRDLGVKGLVTAGSQAPFLYEMGALRGIVDATLPEYFPDWLNVYDRNDLLSYVAKPLFGGRARDVEVRTGQPFPESHSAYWANDSFWTAIKAFIP